MTIFVQGHITLDALLPEHIELISIVNSQREVDGLSRYLGETSVLRDGFFSLGFEIDEEDPRLSILFGVTRIDLELELKYIDNSENNPRLRSINESILFAATGFWPFLNGLVNHTITDSQFLRRILSTQAYQWSFFLDSLELNSQLQSYIDEEMAAGKFQAGAKILLAG